MKKMILSALALLLAAGGFAQENETTEPRSEWLQSFTAVDIEAPLDIKLIRVPASQGPKIVYDTKGSYTTKFRAEVKDRVLRIRERRDPRRTERTSVTLYYNELEQMRIVDAAATLADTLRTTLFDLVLGGEATLNAALDVKDLQMEQTGRSKSTLTGEVRYLSLFVSTGRVNATQLDVMSAEVNAQSNGEALIRVSDRLNGRSSTGGTIRYEGEPGILRMKSRFMAGDISPIGGPDGK